MSNKIQWTSPSNIAIVKYWGKFGTQFPMNPSLSFTLSECKTDTSIEWSVNSNANRCSLEFYYDGKLKPEFEEKVRKYILSIESELTFLEKLHLKINTVNTFPHSAGIASSASAMSALAMCLVSIENEINQRSLSREDFLQRASYLARLGSGSAARSVYAKASLWGEGVEVKNASNEFAIPFGNMLHTAFQKVQDCIFIVNKNEKSISSRAGHQLMETHPYRQARIEQAKSNMQVLMNALKEGNWQQFISVCEEEALSLHGLMMSSNPGYILLQPESLILLSEIKKFRDESQLPLAFTIDAGPNIHLLYPEDIKSEVNQWIQSRLPDYWNERKLIFDRIGEGPEQITL